MMVRPYDQAKLLFLCFLRSSSAALATSEQPSLSKAFSSYNHNHYYASTHRRHSSSTSLSSSTTTASSSSTTDASPTITTPQTPPPSASSTMSSRGLPQLDGHISLRLATKSDVPSIGRCNLATLPENYSPQFYNNHMRRWPDLALVAEHFPAPKPSTPSTTSTANDSFARSSSLKTLIGPYDPLESTRADGKIVGYVLGKVEPHRPSPPNDDIYDSLSPPLPPLSRGHVTSLAILSPYRRRGLAALLMNQLHHHMRNGYQAEDVGLHVRVSNGAAKNLYCGGLGYRVEEVIGRYYQDGEDAYFMQKDLVTAIAEAELLEEEGLLSVSEAELVEKMKEVGDGREEEALEGWRKMGGAMKSYWGNKMGLTSPNQVEVGSAWENGPVELRLPRDIPLMSLVEEVRKEVVVESSSIDTSSLSPSTVSGEDVLKEGKEVFDGEEEDVHRQIMTGSL